MTVTDAILRQVELSRKSEYGWKHLVVWIDNRLARLDHRVQDDDGIIWTVTALYNKKPFADVAKQREAWKRWAEVLG